jgi:hypothetical protein
MISKKYMNGEGYNLNIMIIIFKSIISCNILGLEENFQATCFDHEFLKLIIMLQPMNVFL